MPAYSTFTNDAPAQSRPTKPNMSAEASFRSNLAGFRWAQGVRVPFCCFAPVGHGADGSGSSGHG